MPTVKFAMKSLFAILSLISFGFLANAQNCGQVTNFEHTIQNNNNGTSTYDFWITVQSTSGGNKSVKYTIKCGNYVFIQNGCASSHATTTVYHLGPFTVTTISGEVQLTWSGHTNAVCGGATCIPPQVFQRTQLPVELSTFNTTLQASSVIVDWTTESEQNNDKFIVERSNNGRDFEPIGEVSGNGTTYKTSNYRFVDSNPALGVNYYRLKQIDFNGNFEYSPVSSAIFESMEGILVFPTVAREVLSVALPEQIADEDLNLAIYNMQGAKVYGTNLQGSTAHQLDLPALQPGQYLVSIGNGQINKQTIIVKH